MSPDDKKSIGLPPQLLSAVNYADMSSSRSRRIVFFIQIAAVLTLAALWRETDHNWLNLRLQAAQNAVTYLSCEPQNAYVAPKSGTGDGNRPAADTKSIDAVRQELTKGLSKDPANMRREELDDAYNCAAHPLTPDERTKAQNFLESRSYDLAGTKQFVADLEKLERERVGVPVLGISFDINDLSIIGGLAFGILMSWFYFNLRREQQDVKTVFDLARECDAGTHQGRDEQSPPEPKMLKTAYALLRMTQVLSVPPSENSEDRNVSLSRSLTRIPNLILWTPVVAQFAVLINDLLTLEVADYLHRLVNRLETAIAVYLFIYILFRTVECFMLQQETDQEWIRAWNELNPQQPIPMPKHGFTNWVKASRLKIAATTLFLAVTIHFMDEWRPVLLTAGQKKTLAETGVKIAHGIVDHGHALTLLMLVLLAIVFVLSLFRRRLGVALAWTFTVLALLDITVHNLMAAFASPEYTKNMEGFYSSPLLVIAALLFWISLWHDRAGHNHHPRLKESADRVVKVKTRAAAEHRG